MKERKTEGKRRKVTVELMSRTRKKKKSLGSQGIPSNEEKREMKGEKENEKTASVMSA